MTEHITLELAFLDEVSSLLSLSLQVSRAHHGFSSLIVVYFLSVVSIHILKTFHHLRQVFHATYDAAMLKKQKDWLVSERRNRMSKIRYDSDLCFLKH